MTMITVESNEYWGYHDHTEIVSIAKPVDMHVWGNNNFIFSFDDNDRLYIYGNQSFIHSEQGNDRLFISGAFNQIFTGENNDAIDVYGEQNYVNLDQGNDTAYIYGNYTMLEAGEGNDKLRIHSHYNNIEAGHGDDDIRLHSGHNTVYADNGNDTVYFYSSGNHVHGGEGNDYLYDFWSEENSNIFNGGAGDDYVYAGGANDTAIYEFYNNKTASDIYHGGKGDDSLILLFNYSDIESLVASIAEISSVSEWLGEVEDLFNANLGRTVDFSSLGFDLTSIHFEKLEWTLGDIGIDPGLPPEPFPEMYDEDDGFPIPDAPPFDDEPDTDLGGSLQHQISETVTLDKAYVWGWYDFSTFNSDGSGINLSVLGDFNHITAGSGKNLIKTYGNNNIIESNQAANDNIEVFGEHNEINISSGNNTVVLQDSNNILQLSGTSHTLSINGNQNFVTSMLGNDAVRIKGNDNEVSLGQGEDSVRLHGQNNTLDLGDDNDTLFFHSDLNVVNGGRGDDYLYDYWSQDYSNTVDGGAGNDYVYLGGSDDTGIYHYAENQGDYDQYHGGKGLDILQLHFEQQDILDILATQLPEMDFTSWQDAVHSEFASNLGSTASFDSLGFNLDATQFELLDLNINLIEDASIIEGDLNVAPSEQKPLGVHDILEPAAKESEPLDANIITNTAVFHATNTDTVDEISDVDYLNPNLNSHSEYASPDPYSIDFI